jgi:hypothetical protein
MSIVHCNPFRLNSAKFGICNVVSVNGTLVEDSRVNVHILASTSVPFTLTTVQVPNLALSHTKRITVWKLGLWPCNSFSGNICFEFSVLVLGRYARSTETLSSAKTH